MLINSKRNLTRTPKRLPKQSTSPSRQQLRSLYLEATQSINTLLELPFGDPPEIYSLAVLCERPHAACQWSLYRGEGTTSALEWSHASNDWEQIHSLISAQFPGWELKGKVLSENTIVPTPADPALFSASGSYLPLKSSLEGDLRNMQVPNLLQSISMGKLTGRLQIKAHADTAMVFFIEGAPVHATIKGAEGDEAIIQLISWDEGQFCFFPEPKTEIKTIQKRLEFLIMEGCTFLDQYKSLIAKGLNFDALVVRLHERLSEKEFEELISKGTGIDLVDQKKLYLSIDNRSTLFELLRNHQWSKTEWVPLIFNLVSCGLVAFRAKPEETVAKKAKRSSNLDWSQIQLAEKALLRPDTGLYTYPAFLYFLDKEFCRFERFGRPFSVVLLKIGMIPQNPTQESDAKEYVPLPGRAIRAMGKTIVGVSRQIDLFAHYETLDYVMLLPETNQTQATSFIKRLCDVLQYTNFEDIESSHIDFAIGFASMPDDCKDLETLITQAHVRLVAYSNKA